ncbi:hypothetical protein M501DRAFT_928589 [Patellaria atrata CBS 101060]|uniref:Uncharacterized protein n=1 Tax=Patellaria atrata CBS 101060 TaxID=1346257 RepID=A0A9P4SF33_9PEZI|nr:hypothetical protein M501DRAFT_928589 [Patellaria atrata CBS 101060]
MCIRLIEKYAICDCIYYVHNVDPCASLGRHAVVDRVITVGYICPVHCKGPSGR